MKTILLCLLMSCLVFNGNAQLIKRIGDRAKSKGEQKVDQTVDKTIDDAASGKKKSGKKSSSEEATKEVSTDSEEGEESDGKSEESEMRLYAKYDFVPGTKIIFEDNLAQETVGEFPSLFNTTKGQVQVGEYKGEKMIQSFGCSDVVPRIKGGENGNDVLPDHFTIEFDAFFPKEWAREDWWWCEIKWQDVSDPKYNEYDETVPKVLTFDQKQAKYKDFQSEVPEELVTGGWNHIAIAVNKNMLKVYVNGSRLINTPAFAGNAKNVSIFMTPNGCDNEDKVMIKNVRIAEGGMDLYKRATAEGRFIARGLTFDHNKAVLKPESMGELNRIYKLLNDNGSLKFEIGGHTDADGDEAYNVKLSQQRADAVKEQLVKMGINEGRLTTKGYGKSKPISDNDTPEGKANNRRVEFVKQG